MRAGQGLLVSTHPQQQAAAMHLDAQAAKDQIEANLNSSKALSEVAKNQQTDPLEVLDNLKNFLGQIEKGSKEKADAFKQALMILSAPNSIAVSSQEDIHLSADGQISQSAGDSINLSSQKSLIAHAQSKISLFAAQEGLRAYAGKGKVEIQAQGDGADLIARKGIQIISTEDKVEIKASKKIVLVAGGSQIEISSAGILPTTSGKFEVKAGQHKFVGPQQVNVPITTLPNELKSFSQQIKVIDHTQKIMPNEKYVIVKPNGEYLAGISDINAMTKRIFTQQKEKLRILVGQDAEDFLKDNN